MFVVVVGGWFMPGWSPSFWRWAPPDASAFCLKKIVINAGAGKNVLVLSFLSLNCRFRPVGLLKPHGVVPDIHLHNLPPLSSVRHLSYVHGNRVGAGHEARAPKRWKRTMRARPCRSQDRAETVDDTPRRRQGRRAGSGV